MHDVEVRQKSRTDLAPHGGLCIQKRLDVMRFFTSDNMTHVDRHNYERAKRQKLYYKSFKK